MDKEYKKEIVKVLEYTIADIKSGKEYTPANAANLYRLITEIFSEHTDYIPYRGRY